MCPLQTGYNDGVTNSAILSGASRALQGSATCTVLGQRSVFRLQRASGTTYGEDELTASPTGPTVMPALRSRCRMIRPAQCRSPGAKRHARRRRPGVAVDAASDRDRPFGPRCRQGAGADRMERRIDGAVLCDLLPAVRRYRQRPRQGAHHQGLAGRLPRRHDRGFHQPRSQRRRGSGGPDLSDGGRIVTIYRLAHILAATSTAEAPDAADLQAGGGSRPCHDGHLSAGVNLRTPASAVHLPIPPVDVSYRDRHDFTIAAWNLNMGAYRRMSQSIWDSGSFRVFDLRDGGSQTSSGAIAVQHSDGRSYFRGSGRRRSERRRYRGFGIHPWKRAGRMATSMSCQWSGEEASRTTRHGRRHSPKTLGSKARTWLPSWLSWRR